MTAQVSEPVAVRVVIIDDTQQIRLLLREWIDRLDAFVVVAEAGDAEAGIDTVRRHAPDVVLLDLAMPVMNGLEALSLIRQAAPEASVIVLSAFESGVMRQAALQRGAAAYLQKGSAMAEISRVLNDVAAAARPRSPVRADEPPTAGIEKAPATADAELSRVYSALSVAAHELRGPAGVIHTLAECLSAELRGAASDSAEALLDAIRTQCRVIEQVSADLVVTTKAKHDALAIEVAPLDVLPTLQLAAKAAASEQEILITCPVGLTAHADEVRVQQMLGNLISNAVKYGEPPVRIVAQRGPTHVEFRVIDAGPGVPLDFRGQLFQPFSRAAGRFHSGTGLGLYVVRALAERQGGRAWYEAVNPGSAFCFTLPSAARG